jgi:hypothetical protein
VANIAPKIRSVIPNLPKRAIKRALKYFSANDGASGQDDKRDEDLALDTDAPSVPVHE